MATPTWVTEVLTILKKAGKVPAAHTGEATLTLNLHQGGINAAKLNIGETLK